MGLNTALKDQARRLVRVAQPNKVEGQTILGDGVDAWFKARATFASATETQDQGGIHRATESDTLMFGKRDLEGISLQEPDGRCRVKARDRIEVRSSYVKGGVFEVTAEPEPIRKKRRVIGWQVGIQRVEHDEFTARLPSGP